MDCSLLSYDHKVARPFEAQSSYESQRLWQHVTKALISRNYEEASLFKFEVEEEQRSLAKLREEENLQWTPKFFVNRGGEWKFIYHDIMYAYSKYAIEPRSRLKRGKFACAS